MTRFCPFEMSADSLTAYGEWRVLTWIVADTWSQKTELRLAWVEAAEFKIQPAQSEVRFLGSSDRGRFATEL